MINALDKKIDAFYVGVDTGNFADDKPGVTLSLSSVETLRDLFLMGSIAESKILTYSVEWTEAPLAKIKQNLKDSGTYSFVSYLEGEGATVWVLRPDDTLLNGGKLDKNFVDKLEQELTAKRFASAYSLTQEMMNDRQPPFAIAGVFSIKFTKTVPYFGYSKWGVSQKNNILAVTQVPSMLGNRNKYATWFFKDKNLLSEPDLHKLIGKVGNNYTSFRTVQKYLEENCKPLDQTGKFEDLIISKRSAYKNVFESELAAGVEYPTGEPFANKLAKSGVPDIGPLY